MLQLTSTVSTLLVVQEHCYRLTAILFQVHFSKYTVTTTLLSASTGYVHVLLSRFETVGRENDDRTEAEKG